MSHFAPVGRLVIVSSANFFSLKGHKISSHWCRMFRGTSTQHGRAPVQFLFACFLDFFFFLPHNHHKVGHLPVTTHQTAFLDHMTAANWGHWRLTHEARNPHLFKLLLTGQNNPSTGKCCMTFSAYVSSQMPEVGYGEGERVYTNPPTQRT